MEFDLPTEMTFNLKQEQASKQASKWSKIKTLRAVAKFIFRAKLPLKAAVFSSYVEKSAFMIEGISKLCRCWRIGYLSLLSRRFDPNNPRI